MAVAEQIDAAGDPEIRMLEIDTAIEDPYLHACAAVAESPRGRRLNLGNAVVRGLPGTTEQVQLGIVLDVCDSELRRQR
jgi:hypothetical protein